MSLQDHAEFIEDAWDEQYPAPVDPNGPMDYYPEEMGVVDSTMTDAIVCWSEDEYYRVPFTVAGDVVTFADQTLWVPVERTWMDEAPDKNEMPMKRMPSTDRKRKARKPKKPGNMPSYQGYTMKTVEPILAKGYQAIVERSVADAIEQGIARLRAAKSIPGMSWVWVGCSHSPLKDRSPVPALAILPREIIAKDIYHSTIAIERGWKWASDVKEITGDKYVDYGPLLEKHDWKLPFGRCTARFMVEDYKGCLEFGFCDAKIGAKWMAQGIVEQSIGYKWEGQDTDGFPTNVLIFERSVLPLKAAMNPVTWWVGGTMADLSSLDLKAKMIKAIAAQ